jgi:hypothetical protein
LPWLEAQRFRVSTKLHEAAEPLPPGNERAQALELVAN